MRLTLLAGTRRPDSRVDAALRAAHALQRLLKLLDSRFRLALGQQAVGRAHTGQWLDGAVTQGQHIGINRLIIEAGLLVHLSERVVDIGIVGIDIRRRGVFAYHHLVMALALAAQLPAHAR